MLWAAVGTRPAGVGGEAGRTLASTAAGRERPPLRLPAACTLTHDLTRLKVALFAPPCLQ